MHIILLTMMHGSSDCLQSNLPQFTGFGSRRKIGKLMEFVAQCSHSAFGVYYNFLYAIKCGIISDKFVQFSFHLCSLRLHFFPDTWLLYRKGKQQFLCTQISCFIFISSFCLVQFLKMVVKISQTNGYWADWVEQWICWTVILWALFSNKFQRHTHILTLTQSKKKL